MTDTYFKIYSDNQLVTIARSYFDIIINFMYSSMGQYLPLTVFLNQLSKSISTDLIDDILNILLNYSKLQGNPQTSEYLNLMFVGVKFKTNKIIWF